VRIFLKLLLCLILSKSLIAEIQLGKETILPLEFPKFTLGGEYNVFRHFHAFNDSGLKRDLNNSYGANFYAEVGWLRYLNAGLIVSLTASSPFLGGSNIGRLGLFIKPYLPLGSRVSLFSRISAGPSIAIFHYLNGLQMGAIFPASHEESQQIEDRYSHNDYWPLSLGFHGIAALGAEFFITQRIGLVLESAFRLDMLWAKQFNFQGGTKPTTTGKPAATWFHYMIYDIPVMLSMHIIL
jgi:hypothetical protein